MLGRIFSFVLFALLGLFAGWVWAYGEPASERAWWGLCMGVLGWFVLDLWRAVRVMRWLVDPQQNLPTTWGVWGEVVDRVRRMSRLHERQLSGVRFNLEQFCRPSRPHPMGC